MSKKFRKGDIVEIAEDAVLPKGWSISAAKSLFPGAVGQIWGSWTMDDANLRSTDHSTGREGLFYTVEVFGDYTTEQRIAWVHEDDLTPIYRKL